MQPSASRTSLLLACPRPFGDVELEADNPEEPALYGSAFHEIIAACLRSPLKKPLEKNAKGYARVVGKAVKRYDLPHVRQELAAHVRSSVKVLRSWLKREKLEIVEIEAAYAVRPHDDGSWDARAIEPHDEEHFYKVKLGEIPGTVDVIAANKDRSRIVVLDHKTGMFEDWYMTGEFFASPATVAQLRTLGLAAKLFTKRGKSVYGKSVEVELAIFHADREGLPIVYSELYDGDMMHEHVQALRAALQLVGHGYMRDGAYCRRCPARIGCPARAAALLVDSAEVLTQAAVTVAREPIDPRALYVLPTEEILEPGVLEGRAGRLYDMLRSFRELDKAATAELRRLVKSGAVIETKKGDVLIVRSQTYESLSKKSVLAALGKVAGEKELTRLRKKGVIAEATREMLVSEK